MSVIPRLQSNRQGIYEFPSSCHSGLRAGVQVNIDSLTAWIPGQARNDSYMSVIPRLQSNRQGIFEFSSSCHSGLFLYSVTPAYSSILSLRPPSRSPG